MKPPLIILLLLAAGFPDVPRSPAAAAATTTNPPPKTAGFAFPYRKDDRLVARFTGSDSRPLSPTLYEVNRFRVETFNADGTPNLIGEAPDCRLNLSTKSVSSAGPLTVSQAGGLFSLTGEGFEWDHESGRLVLSNRVHTVVRLNPFTARPPALSPP